MTVPQSVWSLGCFWKYTFSQKSKAEPTMHQLSLVWTDPKGFLMSKFKPASSHFKFEILPCFLRRRRNVQILNMSYNHMLCFRAFAETKSSCNDQNHINWKAEAQASKSWLNFSLGWSAEGEKYIQQLWQIHIRTSTHPYNKCEKFDNICWLSELQWSHLGPIKIKSRFRR